MAGERARGGAPVRTDARRSPLCGRYRAVQEVWTSTAHVVTDPDALPAPFDATFVLLAAVDLALNRSATTRS